MNPHKITAELEAMISEYTDAPYVVCVDNASNALHMCLVYEKVQKKFIQIPSHTYPSVPCEIILAGAHVVFTPSGKYLTGEYQLTPTRIWDSALRFTAGMYRKGQLQCLSFTGHWKRLKLCKGGAILTDSKDAYEWFKRYRFSGRRECSYFEDDFDFIGRNCYMPPVISALGVQMMHQFYDFNGEKIPFPDLTLPYPDLSKYKIYER